MKIKKLIPVALFLLFCCFAKETIAQSELRMSHEVGNASMWFGGDDRSDISPRNIGVGQSLLVPRAANLEYFSFLLSGRFDFAANPSGTGHAVTLRLHIRDQDGNVLSVHELDVPDSFDGGWVTWSNLGLKVTEPTVIVFTTFVVDALGHDLNTGVIGDSDAGFENSQGYSLRGSSTNEEAATWSNWSEHPWDFNFRLSETPFDQFQVPAADSLALVALYNSTDGSNWTDHTNWLTGPVNSWYGVTVSGNRVTELILRDSELAGSIPTELGSLTSLTTLDLANNQLTGDIPAEMSGLASLIILNLYNNQVSGLISTWLSDLTNLTFVDLRVNQMTGEIPTEVGNLTNLNTLYLSQNQLTGEIPTEVGTLTELTELGLDSNQLAGEIPDELINLTNLKTLNLLNNQLTGEIPVWLGSMTSLQELYLTGNQLTGEIPPEYGNLSNLRVLYLNNNLLTGEIPVELGHLANLQWLLISDNQSLTGSLPLSLTNLSALQVFYYNNTNLCEPSDASFQTWLQGLDFVQSTGTICTDGLNFTSEITVSDAVAQTTLTFGMQEGATDSFDADVDLLAPPPPPSGTFDARLRSPQDDFMTDIRSSADETVVWGLVFQTGSGNATISWDPATLPTEGSFRLRDTLGGILVDIDMRAQSTLEPPQGVVQLEIVYSSTVAVEIEVAEGWNMVGSPVTMEDMNYLSLFPNAIENTLFTFTGSYTTPSPPDFAPGTGYWLRFPTAETATLEGIAAETLSLNLVGGWNMVSGPNCSMPYESIGDSGGIMLTGTLFGFAAAYTVATSLEPGSGYWIRTTSAGTVTMDCSTVPANKARVIAENVLDDFRTLTIFDASGKKQTLYFGGELPSGTHPSAYSAPPPAPGAVWQAMFEDGRYVAEGEASAIRLDGASFPLKVKLGSGNEEFDTTIEAIDANGQVLEQHALSTGQAVIISSTQAVTLRLMGAVELPSDFALEQNYPNPFNPVTTIRYSLAMPGPIELSIFNVLGERVALLLEELKAAGEYSASFDASTLSSGIYFYRLTAGDFSETRRMVVLR